MPGGVDQVELVRPPVLRGVRQADGVRLDRDPALALELHGVEDLVAEVPLGHRPAALDEAVGEGRLAVIDVGDDAEVPDVVHGPPGGSFVSAWRRQFTRSRPDRRWRPLSPPKGPGGCTSAGSRAAGRGAGRSPRWPSTPVMVRAATRALTIASSVAWTVASKSGSIRSLGSAVMATGPRGAPAPGLAVEKAMKMIARAVAADAAGARDAEGGASGEAFELVRQQRRVGGHDDDDRAGRPRPVAAAGQRGVAGSPRGSRDRPARRRSGAGRAGRSWPAPGRRRCSRRRPRRPPARRCRCRP